MDTLVADELHDLNPEHLKALEWFNAHAGEAGPRPWREHRPPGFENGPSLVAQRGIHVPSGWTHALSVTSTLGSHYGDGNPLDQSDGTWLFPYAAHAGGDGFGLESRWNRGLVQCWRTHTPVGVMSQVSTGVYRVWGLAYVEDYDLRAGYFLLHGPVSMEERAARWYAHETDVNGDADLRVEEVATDDRLLRTMTWTTRRELQYQFRAQLHRAYEGRCAITGVGVSEVLQAAHILNYSGPSSQSTCNGLLLRADMHLLFDRHLLTVNPDDMAIALAPTLQSSHYQRFERRHIALPSSTRDRPSVDRLAVHFEVCRRAWQGIA